MDKPWATRRVAHRLPTGRRLPTSSTALNPIDIKSGKVKTKSPAPALAYSSPVTVQTTGTTALRLISEHLVSSPVAWYGPSELVNEETVNTFPNSLERLPILLPTGHSALRAGLDHWFHVRDLHVRVVGEFEDSALMSVFAARGLGVFPISRLGADDLALIPGLLLLGECDGVTEDIYAIRNRQSRHHPLIQRLTRGL